MNQPRRGIALLIFIFAILGTVRLALATDNRTRTTTTQNQTIFTNNSDCQGGTGFGTCVASGSAPNGGMTVPINGGSVNFHLCSRGMGNFSIDTDLDPSCRVTPPMIPPGADTQVGTGLNPIRFCDNAATTDSGCPSNRVWVNFGGETNDPIPSGSSNITIPGFLVHGPVGEQTLRCLSTATCGTGMEKNVITHFQDFRSVPSGVPITPGGPNCAQPRCNHIEFNIDQLMKTPFAPDITFKIDFVIDSAVDADGNLVPLTANGSWTQTCTGNCANTSGTFHVNTETFTPASTGFVTIDSGPPGCPAGTLLDPFHANGNTCRSQ